MEDILVSNSIINNRNNRIIIFHGAGEQEGQINVLSSNNVHESFDNFIYLKKYLSKYYASDLSIKSIISDPYDFHKNYLLLFMLEQYNMAVFEDITSDFDLENGNFRQLASFYLPSSISEKQKEAILHFKEYFSNYKQIVFSHITVDSRHHLNNSVDDFISGDDINRLDEFLHVSLQYIKNN